MIPVLIFYGALAGVALWATYKDDDLFWVGFWLALGFGISNILAFSAPVTWRPGPYTMIEMMVALAAYCSWATHRDWRIAAIVTINALSVVANIAFAANFPPDKRQIFIFELTTNLCFAAECLLATWVGLRHGHRAFSFRLWPRLHRRAAQPHVARQDEP